MLNPYLLATDGEYRREAWQQFKTALTFTDLNDAVVLGSAIITTFTGGDAVHIDGTVATTQDIQAAKNGLLLPVVSGSAVSKVGNAIDGAVDAAKTTERTITRQRPGNDGAASKHIIENDMDGNTVSKTHQVVNENGTVIHQHQDFVPQNLPAGEPKLTRQFPDEWVRYPKRDK